MNCSDLPGIPDLIRISKAIAMLDAILCEDWEARYYSFNSKWSKTDPEKMVASMRNGRGDEYFIWFAPVGAAIKGFAHESPMNPANGCCGIWPGVLADVPAAFDEFLHEPAFELNFSTFCFWRAAGDNTWNQGRSNPPRDSGEDPDGSKRLLSILDGKASSYVNYAASYFERTVDEGSVSQVYELKPITSELLVRLGCERTLASLEADMVEIGYPRG